MNYLHITQTAFTNQSRIVKQIDSSLKLSNIENIYVCALNHSKKFDEFEEINQKIFINRINLKSKNLSKLFVFQIIKYIEFLIKIYSLYKNKKIKIIHVHSLELLCIGYLLKIFFKSKLIYDAHELEIRKNKLNSSRKFIYQFIEKIFITKIDKLLVVSKSIAEWYKKEYNIIDPLIIYNSPKIKYTKNNSYFREKYNLRNDQLILLYLGGLFENRGIEIILQSFDEINRNNKLVVIFMGYGPMEKIIKKNKKFNKFFFHHGPVHPNDIVDIASSANVGLSLIQNTSLSYYYCMPNKIFEYLNSDLPVIVSNMKDMSQFVKENKIGWVLDKFNSRNFNELINEIDETQINYYKKNVHTTIKKYSWEVQEEKLFKVWNELNIKL